MKHFAKAFVLAAMAIASTVGITQSASAQQIRGVGYADLQLAARDSAAFTTAAQQRETTYQAQYQQAVAERDATAQRLQPLADQFNTARASASPDENALRQSIAQIQQIQNESEQRIQQILQPVALSEAYVTEQIGDQLRPAVLAAQQRAKISLLLNRGAVIEGDDAYDLTDEITAELNRLIPTAQLVPPAGWLPRAQRERLAAQQAAQQGQAPATTPQPESR